MVILFVILGFMFQTGGQQQNPPQQPERSKAILALEEAIKGKEEMPAEQVFKNIQIFKGRPAGQILRIMEFGFSPALGVRCNHCHEPGKWENDDMKQKQVARQMSLMSRELNTKLQTITGKDDAAVNCTTCHRGDTKPAQNLPGMRR